MPSAQDCAERLREQAYRTLLPQIRDLEEELQRINSSLSTGVHQIGQKLEALSHIELPTTELILSELLEEVTQQKDLETSALVQFGRGLRQKETQEEILTFLLDNAQKYFPRVALFAVRGDRFVGWSSRGYSEAASKNISSCSFLRSEYPQFQEAIESEIPTAVTDLPSGEPLQPLQQEAQGPWHLLPLRAMQRPVALLLAGAAEGISCHPDALSILVDFTTLRLENIALKILNDLTAERWQPAPQPVPSVEIAAAMPAAAPEPSPEMPVAREVVAQARIAEPVPVEPIPAEAEVKFEEQLIPEAEPPAKAVPVPAARIEFIPPAVEQEAIPIPAPQPQVVKGPPREAPQVLEDEKLHVEAKRFARLLVSEIKLYNEKHVAEGRENRDLYLRLKRDIDRSREMYENRVSPVVSRKIDYFHDEIIRILGDNDPSTLGSDYPGPRVES